MYKILFTGPESTGKSTLAKTFARQFETVWVPEYARLFLEIRGPEYTEQDLLYIAEGQLQLEDYLAAYASPFIFCDTSMLVMKVWSMYQYQRVHPWIAAQWEKQSYDLHVLCGIDVPWEAGPFREHPNAREELYALYKKELLLANKPFIELWGSMEERLAKLQPILEQYLLTSI
jgi:NadR type nicotinamide-nucleotide adenylyltransferase